MGCFEARKTRRRIAKSVHRIGKVIERQVHPTDSNLISTWFAGPWRFIAVRAKITACKHQIFTVKGKRSTQTNLQHRHGAQLDINSASARRWSSQESGDVLKVRMQGGDIRRDHLGDYKDTLSLQSISLWFLPPKVLSQIVLPPIKQLLPLAYATRKHVQKVHL